MDAQTLERLEANRLALERNPNDRAAVLSVGRILRDIGQCELGADLIGAYLKSNPSDPEVANLARELGSWSPAPAAPAPLPARDTRPSQALFDRVPASFSEISGHLDTVTGLILKDQEKYLFEKVKSLPDGAVILEMGCNRGKSTCAMAFACVGTRKHIYSIDTYSGNEGHMGRIEDFEEEWRGNLRRFGLDRYATALRGYTFQVVPDRTRYPAPDFVFIDASHEFTDVLDDFRSVYPYVKDNGWISFHDVERGWPGSWRVWLDYGTAILENHEYSSTLACGRKVAGRPFRRRQGNVSFPFAKEILRDLTSIAGRSHPLIAAMETSLEGRWGSIPDREAILKAETRLAEAPEPEFHAVLKDMIQARDGRIDGQVRLWYGLSLLGQGRLEEALPHFHAISRVSLPLSSERALSYQDYIRRQRPELPFAAPAPKGEAAAAAFQAHVAPSDTVVAVGGDGSMLEALKAACKISVEADRDTRKHSITEHGVDSLEAWDDLPDGCADVLVSDDGLSSDPAPLPTLKQARAKLRAGGKAVFTVGREAAGAEGRPALYAWTPGTLENLFKAAGFASPTVETFPGGSRMKVMASR